MKWISALTFISACLAAGVFSQCQQAQAALGAEIAATERAGETEAMMNAGAKIAKPAHVAPVLHVKEVPPAASMASKENPISMGKTEDNPTTRDRGVSELFEDDKNGVPTESYRLSQVESLVPSENEQFGVESGCSRLCRWLGSVCCPQAAPKESIQAVPERSPEESSQTAPERSPEGSLRARESFDRADESSPLAAVPAEGTLNLRASDSQASPVVIPEQTAPESPEAAPERSLEGAPRARESLAGVDESSQLAPASDLRASDSQTNPIMIPKQTAPGVPSSVGSGDFLQPLINPNWNAEQSWGWGVPRNGLP